MICAYAPLPVALLSRPNVRQDRVVDAAVVENGGHPGTLTLQGAVALVKPDYFREIVAHHGGASGRGESIQ